MVDLDASGRVTQARQVLSKALLGINRTTLYSRMQNYADTHEAAKAALPKST